MQQAEQIRYATILGIILLLYLTLAPVTENPEGVVVGFQNFGRLLTQKNIRIPIKNLGTPLPPYI
jgi:hypothetical protein